MSMLLMIGNMKLVVRSVGIGENQNGFGVKVIDDGEEEDVTNGEASGEVTVGVGVNKND